jgi:hypothetical protein
MTEILDRMALMLIFAVGGVLYLLFFALVANLVMAVGSRWERAKRSQEESVVLLRAEDEMEPLREPKTLRRRGVHLECLQEEQSSSERASA